MDPKKFDYGYFELIQEKVRARQRFDIGRRRGCCSAMHRENCGNRHRKEKQGENAG
jgi:hypothetical protein